MNTWVPNWVAGLQFHSPFIHTGKKKEKTDLLFFKYTYSIVTQFLSDCHCFLLVALSGIEPWTFSSQPTFPAKSCIHYDFPPQHALYVCTSETFASGPFALSSKIAPILQILRTSASKTQFKFYPSGKSPFIQSTSRIFAFLCKTFHATYCCFSCVQGSTTWLVL